MTLLNRIDVDIPAEDFAAIQNAIQVLQEKLLPHLITLSVDDRKQLPKMGDRNNGFVRKAVQYAREVPELVPRYVEVEQMEKDLKAVDLLSALCHPLEHLTASLDDTVLAAGSGAYSGSLAYYQAVKGAARSRVHGAQAIVDDLSARFVTATRASTMSTPETKPAST